jgi:hypothetical protein
MDMDTGIETDTPRHSKEASWRAHASLLCKDGGNGSVGGARCQSRFASSRTAVPLFREEAKSACYAVENGSGVVTLATTSGKETASPKGGRRCHEQARGAGGTWRYCFEEMKWVLGPSDASGGDTVDAHGSDRGGTKTETETETEMDLGKALERIAQLENLLKRHGIAITESY